MDASVITKFCSGDVATAKTDLEAMLDKKKDQLLNAAKAALGKELMKARTQDNTPEVFNESN